MNIHQKMETFPSELKLLLFQKINNEELILEFSDVDSMRVHFQDVGQGLRYFLPENIVDKLPENIIDEIEALWKQGI